MKKESDDRKERLEQRRDVVTVLGNQGITISEESIPYEQVEMHNATIKVYEDRAHLASSLLGEVSETTNAESTVYSAKSGNMMFLSDSFSFVYETEREVKTSEDAKNIAKDIADKLKISHSGGEISVRAAAGGYRVFIPQVFDGMQIFGGEVELKISPEGNVLGSGRFIGSGKPVETSGRTMDVSALLLEFADEMSGLGIEKTEITKLGYGYMPQSPAGGRVYLVPTLEISTTSGVFYISMSDGSLMTM